MTSPTPLLDLDRRPGCTGAPAHRHHRRSRRLDGRPPRGAPRHRHRARRGARPRPGPERPHRCRRRLPRAGRRPDDREGGLRPPPSPPRRDLLVDEVAGEPADVHAPRAQLHAGVPRPDAVRLPRRAHEWRGDGAGRRAGRARRAARRPGRALRAGGLAAHAQLQRRDRGVVRGGVRHGRPGRRRALLPGERDRVLLAAGRRAAHPAAAQRGGPPPADRRALLVQPDRVPQPVDDGRGRPRVPRRRLRRGRAAVQHLLRRRRRDRRGRRRAAQRGLRGPHRPRAVAGGRPPARRQHPHRPQPGGLRRAARGDRRDGGPDPARRLLPDGAVR